MNEIVSPLQSISYTNRDFSSVYVELLDLVKELTNKWDPSISNESDPGVILLKLNAIIADKCNYAIDKSLLECFPLSVTQESNARQLFEQLGYYMRWYRAAYTDVYMKWTGDKSSAEITIPAFTMVCDANSNTIYTLLGPATGIDNVNDIKLGLDDSVGVVVSAIQGVAVKYDINGDYLITPSHLDYNNRIYFPVTNVAENGIFITNASSTNYSSWQRKDNLLIENLGNTYYKFGVTKTGNACYIEFPEDAEEIINEGIYITYIKTDGERGNISAKQLDRFYNMNVATVGNTSYDLNTDTVMITNFAASVGGQDYEDINEAYRSYKKTVGTFNTLVTLRDYINYINNSDLVSNCFVCDRTNDVQTSYKILASVNDVDQKINFVENYVDTSSNTIPRMTAYDIKLYLMQYVNPINADTSRYLATFDMLNNDNSRIIQMYMDDNKSLNHNVLDILPPSDTSAHICYFKNKCPVSFTVITQSSLTSTQIIEMKTNIVSAIYKMFNANKLEFGEKISYDLLYQTIMNSDTRIKNISLDNLAYRTFAVYYDNDVKLTYDGTNWLDDDWNIVNPLDYGVTIPAGALAGATITLPDKFVEVDITDLNEYLSVVCSNKDLDITVDFDSTKYNNFITYLSGKSLGKYAEVEFTYDSGWEDASSTSITLSNFGISLSDTPTNGDKLRVRVSYQCQFRNDVYAKSVLAGNTPLYIKDETFDYRLQGYYSDIIDNIEKVRSNLNITFVKDSANPSNNVTTYTLRKNEALQFYSPNLINAESYQKYTKYEYQITNNISANSSYELSNNEVIIFYWKSNEDEVYNYHSYGKGTIICPTFDMHANSASMIATTYNLVTEANGIYTETSNGLNGDMSPEANDAIKALSENDNILSGTRAIQIQYLNEFTIDSSSGVGLYWILNSKTENNKYVLFDSGDTTRTLSSGEYFIFTNSTYTSYTTLGTGTTITRDNISDVWQVDAIDIDELSTYGLSAIQDRWFTLPTGDSVNFVENKFSTFSEGCSIKIQGTDDKTSSLYTTNVAVTGVTLSDFSADAWNESDYKNNTSTVLTYKTSGTAGWYDAANNAVDLAALGITITGSPSNNNTITITKKLDYAIQFSSGGYSITVPSTATDYRPTTPISLADFNIQYKLPDGTSYNDLSKLVLSENTSISAKALLAIRLSSVDYQYLLDNQSIIYTIKDTSSEVTINGSAETSSEYPVALMSSFTVVGDGDVPIYTSTIPVSVEYTETLEPVYLSLYKQEVLKDITVGTANKVVFNDDGTVVLTFDTANNAGGYNEISFNVKLPIGKYILPVQNNNASDDISSSLISFGGTQCKFMNSNTNADIAAPGIHYILLDNSSNNNAKALLFKLNALTANASLKLMNILKYEQPSTLSDTEFADIEAEIRRLDTQNLYKYNIEIESTNLISDPLLPESFFNPNHFYNSFTIPVIKSIIIS